MDKMAKIMRIDSTIPFKRLSTINLGNVSVRFLTTNKENQDVQFPKETNNCDGTLLFLACDVLSGTTILKKNYIRVHGRFAKTGLASKINLTGFRIDGINNSGVMWFYNIKGLFRIAFELGTEAFQKDCLTLLQSEWLKHYHDPPLPPEWTIHLPSQQQTDSVIQDGQHKPGELTEETVTVYIYNKEKIVNVDEDMNYVAENAAGCNVSTDNVCTSQANYIDTNGQIRAQTMMRTGDKVADCCVTTCNETLEIKSENEYGINISSRRIELGKACLGSVKNSSVTYDKLKRPSQSNELVEKTNALAKDHYEEMAHGNERINCVREYCNKYNQLLLNIKSGDNTDVFEGDLNASFDHNEEVVRKTAAKSSNEHNTEVTHENEMESLDRNNEPTKSNANNQEMNDGFQNKIEMWENLTAEVFLDKLNVFLKECVCISSDILMHYVISNVLKVVNFLQCFIDKDRNFQDGLIIFHLLEKYSVLINKNDADALSIDTFGISNEKYCLLYTLSEWLGKEFCTLETAISQRVEIFKQQNIQNITNLPTSEETVNSLFPSFMTVLVTNWLGGEFETLTHKTDSEGILTEHDYYCSKRRKEDKSKRFSLVQLILEFTTSSLISGISHVVIAKLKSQNLL